MKKMTLALLITGLFGVAQIASAIVLQPNEIKNTTNETITVQTTRIIKCLGKKDQTTHSATSIAAGETGKIYIMGGSMATCTSAVTQLSVSAPGILPGTMNNPTAKDYTVSEKIGSPRDTTIVYKQLVIE